MKKMTWILVLVLAGTAFLAGCQAQDADRAAASPGDVPSQAAASSDGQPSGTAERAGGAEAEGVADIDSSFILPEYVSMQGGETAEVSLPDYLPSQDMVISYTRPTHEPGGYFFDIRVSNGAANYVAESVPDLQEENEGTTSAVVAGRYAYDPDTDCLVDSPAEDLDASTPYAGPVGMAVEATDLLTVETMPRLFRVLTEAGVFDDCIAVREVETGSNGAVVNAVAFYAPHVGNVLRVVDYGIGSADYRATLVADRVDLVAGQEADTQMAAEASPTDGLEEPAAPAAGGQESQGTPAPAIAGHHGGHGRHHG